MNDRLSAECMGWKERKWWRREGKRWCKNWNTIWLYCPSSTLLTCAHTPINVRRGWLAPTHTHTHTSWHPLFGSMLLPGAKHHFMLGLIWLEGGSEGFDTWRIEGDSLIWKECFCPCTEVDDACWWDHKCSTVSCVISNIICTALCEELQFITFSIDYFDNICLCHVFRPLRIRWQLNPAGIIPLSWCGSDYVRGERCVAAATLCTVSTVLLQLSCCGCLQGLGFLDL